LKSVARLALALAFLAAPALADEPGTTSAPPPFPLETSSPSPAPAGAEAASPDRAGYSYNYAVFDSRYADVFGSLDAYKPFGPRTRLRPFVDAAVVRDTRTGTGYVPLTLSDNYVLGAAGLQYTDGSGLRVFAQGGATSQFGPVAATPSGGDVRGGVQYYRDFGIPATAHHGYANFYGSTTYYSRYQDWILYAQAEAISNLGSHAQPLEAYVRPVLTLDTAYHYYSNLAEATVGVRYHPFGMTGPIVSVEGAAGWYLRGAARPGGLPVFYTDFRPTVSYGFSL
jgi:hypothetical protein